MKYDLDELVDRRRSDSVKWDWAEEDVLPMWVADMDFRTAPEVTQALAAKVSTGIFGYHTVPERFLDAIIGWWAENHQFKIEKDWLLPATGVLPSIAAMLRTFIRQDETIILQTPAYNHFFVILENGGYNFVCNDLKYDEGHYTLDLDDLETKAADPKARLLILCNPHNPVGRAWKKEELEKIATICATHNVMVVSDEIHSDLVFEGHEHIPFAAIARNFEINTITCGSPCKTFNISGLPISYLIATDKELLEKVEKTLAMQENSYPNPIAAEALIAAYSKGAPWLKELKDYLFDNYSYLEAFCREHLPQIRVVRPEATYLVWLDCSALQIPSDELSNILLKDGKLWLNSGTIYGAAGEGFLRMNIGCPRSLLTEGLKRLKETLDTLSARSGDRECET